MLTLEQVKSLVDAECEYNGRHQLGCEECIIYNTFNRSGSCAERIFMDQTRPEVAALIKLLQVPRYER